MARVRKVICNEMTRCGGPHPIKVCTWDQPIVCTYYQKFSLRILNEIFFFELLKHTGSVFDKNNLQSFIYKCWTLVKI
jgi:hypothetical protein